MLTLVEVNTSQGGLLSFPLADTSLGFVIQNIEGLDPVKATVVSSPFAQQDGAQYQSSRRETRNITMTIGLDPDYVTTTIRDLRTSLYSVFMPKTSVDLRFLMDDGLDVHISGLVESCETAMFSADPAVDISILCFDPDFIDPDDVVLSGSSTAGSTATTVNYAGSVDTGFLFTLSVNRTLTDFSIYQQSSDGTQQQLDFHASLITGDTLKISTIKGNKYVTLTRAGVDSSLLYAISPQSSWLGFVPGTNSIRVYSEGAAIPYTIDYITRYGGL